MQSCLKTEADHTFLFQRQVPAGTKAKAGLICSIIGIVLGIIITILAAVFSVAFMSEFANYY